MRRPSPGDVRSRETAVDPHPDDDGHAPTDLSSAMTRPREFLLSPQPWRGFLFVLLDVPFGLLLLVIAVPGLCVSVTEPGRAILARGASWLLARHVELIDPRLSHVLNQVPQRRTRLLGGVLATGLLFAPVAFCLLLIEGVGVLVCAAAPLLVTWDPISIFDWVVSRQRDAILVSLLTPILLVVLLYSSCGLALVQASFLRSLVSVPREDVEEELVELRSSRDLLLDAFDTERSRIEGMLHDGVQHHLVALAMTLGLAEATAPNPQQREILARAHRQADEALAELRRVIRGVLPRALQERGLVPAVEDLIAHSSFVVDNRIHLNARLPRRVEQVSYFVISEALSNVMKHAAASRAVVHGQVRDGVWWLTVEDDGAGGAQVRAGGGLDGLGLRAAALGGHLRVTERDGGGTVLVMTCPVTEAEGHRTPSQDPREGAT